METKEKPRIRSYKFIGKQQANSIVVGNSSDVLIDVEGDFDLAGILHCPRRLVLVRVMGTGKMKFRGSCKMLRILYAIGRSVLDFREVRCGEIEIEKLGGDVEMLVGDAQWINTVNMAEHAMLKITGKPTILNFTLHDHAKIIHSKHHIDSATIL